MYFVTASKESTKFHGGAIFTIEAYGPPSESFNLQATPACCTSKDHIFYEEFKIE